MRKCLIVLGQGDFRSELRNYSDPNQPRSEFIEIARYMQGDITSYTIAKSRRGAWFRYLFQWRPTLGAAFDAALQGKKYNAMYTTGEDIGIPLGLFLALRRWNGKLICIAHSVGSLRAMLFRIIGPSIFHKVITVCRSQSQVLLHKSFFPLNRISFLYNWVDDRFFDPATIAAEETGYFMCCGAENRDYKTLISAFREMDNYTLYIFGHGFNSGNKNNIDTSDIPINVKFMERVSYDDLRRYYKGALCVVVPLNKCAYAAGVTGLIEAMAMGRPVIVSNTVGIADYLGPVPEHFRVEPENKADLKQALEKMLCTRDELESMGYENRNFIIQKCSLDNYIKIVGQYFNTTIDL